MRLTEVGETIRRRWRVVVASVLVALMGAAGLSSLWPDEYTATAIVSVSPITPNPFGGTSAPQQLNMNTEQQVVRSTEVATAAAELLGSTRYTPRELTTRVSVTSPSDSQILQIAFTANTGARAAAGANAFAAAYLDSRVAGADELAERLISALEDRINELIEQQDDDASESLTAVAVQQQIIELRQQQSSLVTVALNPGRIIESATAPGSPSSPGLPVTLIGGLVGGLLAGIALALFRDRHDRRITHAARLRDLLGGSLVIDGTVESDRDEPYRHALLELTRLHPRSGTDGPVLVALAGPADGQVYEAATCLVEVAHSHRMRARLIDSDRMDMSAVDAGWPGSADVLSDWASDDLVVLDLTMITSRTRRIALARRCHAIMVAATKRSRRKPVQEFVGQLAVAEREIDLGILLPAERRTSAREFSGPKAGSDGMHARRPVPGDAAERSTGWPATIRPGR
ncbi:Wzz/FepE/Etk N-terminal domain-containing protein [Phytoactinopolyspora mesophila]|nr:Wzz/FepE/Etk N-terminal domain-containing protein [Phytoactinopolyspora mesophila]